MVGRRSIIFASFALEIILLNSALGSSLSNTSVGKRKLLITLQKKRVFKIFSPGHRAQFAALGKIHHFIAQLHWKVGRSFPDLSSLSSIFIFLQFNGGESNGIQWKLLKKKNLSVWLNPACSILQK